MLERSYFNGGKTRAQTKLTCRFTAVRLTSTSPRPAMEPEGNLMADVEKHAHRVIQIMKDAGVCTGELMDRGVIETVWLYAEREGPLTALQHAHDRNWTKDGGGVFYRSTARDADLA
jgi:hypothetical protein